MENLVIRIANPEDFEALYNLGLKIPEINVSDNLPFIGPEEFKNGLSREDVVCFLAEIDKKISGFVYGDVEKKDLDGKTWSALMYIVVSPDLRGKGVAQKLYEAFEKEAKGRGATILYSWANAEEGSRIIPFYLKNGLKPGHLYRWMEKEL